MDVRKRSVSLIEILVVMGVLIPIAAFFGTNVYSGHRDKIAFKRSYDEVNRSIDSARRCCIYYGIDVCMNFRKQDGIYILEIRPVKSLPIKAQRLFSKSLVLKGVSHIVPVFLDKWEQYDVDVEEFSVLFEGTLGGVSTKELILKRKNYEKTIVLT